MSINMSTLSVISDFFPIVAALFYYRRFDSILKIVALFTVASAVSDITQVGLLQFKIHNTCPVLHAYIIATILLLGTIYYKAISNGVAKKIVIILSSAAVLFALINIFFIEGIFGYPSLSNTVISVILILFSLTYFYQLLNKQEFVHIEKQGLFWINASVLFYYSVTLFLFMLFKKMSHEQLVQYYSINSLTNVAANILFTVGLLCKPENANEQTNLK